MPVSQLQALLQGLPGAEALSETQLTALLSLARIPDSTGKLPGASGYVETYDLAYAAYLTCFRLAAAEQVTSVSSEGTSVSVKATEWKAMQQSFLMQSSIGQQQGLPYLEIPLVHQTRPISHVDPERGE